MTIRWSFRCLFVLVYTGALFAHGELQNVQVNLEAPKPEMAISDTLGEKGMQNETTLADQTSLAITVYNNNRALVREQRRVTMLPGEVALKFSDVAEQIMPQTVSLSSISAPGKLHILEQNYEYDLMSPQKLMEKYVGKKVRLINKNAEYSFYEQEATLLSVNNGPVYDIEGDIYLGHPGEVVLPEIPEELIAKPSLIWLLQNQGADHEIEVTYLTSGISWRADYVLTLAKDSGSMDLEGWVTLNNGSGATYANAQLKLVAGEVNVVPDQVMYKRSRGVVMAEAVPAAPAPMQEESFAEYHLYTLPRATTIKQNQSKQVRLLSALGAKTEKRYEFRGRHHFYTQQVGGFDPEQADVLLLFQNEEENELGMPLPAGTMRIYQEDQSGALQFAGEDHIDHTPKDEEVRLRMGQAFDLVGERTQTDFRRINSNTCEAEFEIELRNHKEEAVVVHVVEPLPGDWSILENSHEFEKKDAHTAIFPVQLKADGEAALTYRVRIAY